MQFILWIWALLLLIIQLCISTLEYKNYKCMRFVLGFAWVYASVRVPRMQGQCELHLIPLPSSKLAMRQTPLLATGNGNSHTQAQTNTYTHREGKTETPTDTHTHTKHAAQTNKTL